MRICQGLSAFFSIRKEKGLTNPAKRGIIKLLRRHCRDLGCVGGQSLLQERVVHRLLVCPLLLSEGGGDMQSTFQQILLLGGAVGSIVGGVFAVLSYLKNYKKKK